MVALFCMRQKPISRIAIIQGQLSLHNIKPSKQCSYQKQRNGSWAGKLDCYSTKKPAAITTGF